MKYHDEHADRLTKARNAVTNFNASDISNMQAEIRSLRDPGCTIVMIKRVARIEALVAAIDAHGQLDLALAATQQAAEKFQQLHEALAAKA